ncbi:hypothetical protein [Desulfococcus sp.]|uniref:hypothetical protein n=1 Tax=Desulfococcus sp. TaxID=2025834 RepID=UPI00359405C2
MASFKENLLKKIEIDRLADRVTATVGPSGSGKKADLEAMRRLLAMGPYAHRKERDMDLYLLTDDPQKTTILVLDNELPFYHTSVDDVVLRKSPTVKEMISIRNAVKILNDQDVVTSKRETSVGIVRKSCIQQLDLSFDEKDLETIAADGKAALDAGDAGAVIETLTLFEEVLGYVTPDRGFQVKGYRITGRITEEENAVLRFGPILIFDATSGKLMLSEEPIRSADKDKSERLEKIAAGDRKADRQGDAVFAFLREKALRVSYDPMG